MEARFRLNLKFTGRPRPLTKRTIKAILRRMRQRKMLTQEQWQLLERLVNEQVLVPKASRNRYYVRIEGREPYQGEFTPDLTFA